MSDYSSRFVYGKNILVFRRGFPVQEKKCEVEADKQQESELEYEQKVKSVE